MDENRGIWMFTPEKQLNDDRWYTRINQVYQLPAQHYFYQKEILFWANYNNSLTWIKAIWGWFPLLTMISSELVVSSL